jgi:hypothetical protein
MAKKLRLLLMLCVCLLISAAARADDGGFFDMIWHWDIKFFGIGTDFHPLCLNDSGQRIKGCEEWFTHLFRRVPFKSDAITDDFAWEDIRHEVTIRVSGMFSYGERIPSEVLAAGETTDTRVVGAARMMGLYYYHVKHTSNRLSVGGGAGTIPVFLSTGVVWRPIAAASVEYGLGSSTYVRFDETYFGNTITAADLGHPTAIYSAGPKWAPSVTIGWDLRRVKRKP